MNSSKYDLTFLEYTYLSNPSRLIKIMKDNRNEEYFNIDAKELKIIKKNNDK